MSDAPLPGGYIWRQHVNQVQQGAKTARTYLRKLLDERPSPLLATTYLTHIALQIADIESAANELGRIVPDAKPARTEKRAKSEE